MRLSLVTIIVAIVTPAIAQNFTISSFSISDGITQTGASGNTIAISNGVTVSNGVTLGTTVTQTGGNTHGTNGAANTANGANGANGASSSSSGGAAAIITGVPAGIGAAAAGLVALGLPGWI
jgi:hypothetical protein